MNFLNTCILNMFCQNKCANFTHGCSGVLIQDERCSAYNYVQYLLEHNHNIADLIKQNISN